MPIANTTPPQEPIRVETVTYVESTKAYTMKIAGAGSKLVTSSTNLLVDIRAALVAASKDLSTYVSVIGPSATPIWAGQLNDMPSAQPTPTTP